MQLSILNLTDEEASTCCVPCVTQNNKLPLTSNKNSSLTYNSKKVIQFLKKQSEVLDEILDRIMP